MESVPMDYMVCGKCVRKIVGPFSAEAGCHKGMQVGKEALYEFDCEGLMLITEYKKGKTG